MKHLYNDKKFLTLLFNSRFYHVKTSDEYASKIDANAFASGIELFTYALSTAKSNNAHQEWKVWLRLSSKDMCVYLSQKTTNIPSNLLEPAQILLHHIKAFLFSTELAVDHQNNQYLLTIEQKINFLIKLVQKTQYDPCCIDSKNNILSFEELKTLIVIPSKINNSNNAEITSLLEALEAFSAMVQLEKIEHPIERDFLLREAILQQALNNRTKNEWFYDSCLEAVNILWHYFIEMLYGSKLGIEHVNQSIFHPINTFKKAQYSLFNPAEVFNQTYSSTKKEPHKTLFTFLSITITNFTLHAINQILIRWLEKNMLKTSAYTAFSQLYLIYIAIGSIVQVIHLPNIVNLKKKSVEPQQQTIREEHIKLSADYAREKAEKDFDALVENKKHQDDFNTDYESSFYQMAQNSYPRFTREERCYFAKKHQHIKTNLTVFQSGFKQLESYYPEKKWSDIIRLSASLRPKKSDTSSASRLIDQYGALSVSEQSLTPLAIEAPIGGLRAQWHSVK